MHCEKQYTPLRTRWNPLQNFEAVSTSNWWLRSKPLWFPTALMTEMHWQLIRQLFETSLVRAFERSCDLAMCFMAVVTGSCRRSTEVFIATHRGYGISHKEIIECVYSKVFSNRISFDWERKSREASYHWPTGASQRTFNGRCAPKVWLRAFFGDPLDRPECIGIFQSGVAVSLLSAVEKFAQFKTSLNGAAWWSLHGLRYYGVTFITARNTLKKIGQPHLVIRIQVSQIQVDPTKIIKVLGVSSIMRVLFPFWWCFSGVFGTVTIFFIKQSGNCI